MTFDFKKDLLENEYFVAFHKKVEILSVAGFFWDVGKTLIEGWHSIGWFILELNWVIGWMAIVALCLPKGVAALPVLTPSLIVLALFTHRRDMRPLVFLLISASYIASTIILIYLKLSKRFWDFVLEILERLPSSYLMAVFAIIGICLSVTIHVPPLTLSTFGPSLPSSDNMLWDLMASYNFGFLIRGAGWIAMLSLLVVALGGEL
jgi:hypothetical protein